MFTLYHYYQLYMYIEIKKYFIYIWLQDGTYKKQNITSCSENIPAIENSKSTGNKLDIYENDTSKFFFFNMNMFKRGVTARYLDYYSHNDSPLDSKTCLI